MAAWLAYLDSLDNTPAQNLLMALLCLAVAGLLFALLLLLFPEDPS